MHSSRPEALCTFLRNHFAINDDGFSLADCLTGRRNLPILITLSGPASMSIAFSMRRYSRYLSPERRTVEFGLPGVLGLQPSVSRRRRARLSTEMSSTHSRIDLIDVFIF